MLFPPSNPIPMLFLFMHEQLHFAHFVAKFKGHHLGCGHSLPNDFDVKGPLHELNGTRDCPFQ